VVHGTYINNFSVYIESFALHMDLNDIDGVFSKFVRIILHIIFCRPKSLIDAMKSDEHHSSSFTPAILEMGV